VDKYATKSKKLIKTIRYILQILYETDIVVIFGMKNADKYQSGSNKDL
jgi:hypothetical protein